MQRSKGSVFAATVDKPMIFQQITAVKDTVTPSPKDKFARRQTPAWPLMRRLMRDYLKPHLSRLGSAYACMIVSAAMTASLAKLMEPIINKVFLGNDPTQLYEVATFVIVAFVLRGLSTYGHMVQMNRLGQRIVADVQNQMVRRVLGADLAYFHANASGQLLSRITSDVGVMRMSVAEVLTSFGKSTLTLIFLIGVMFWQDWKLAMIAFIAFPLGAWFVNRLARKLRSVARETQVENAKLSASLTQTFQGVRHVKAYNREGHEANRLGVMVERLYKLTTRAYRIGTMATPVTEIFSAFAIVTVIIYGGLQVMDHTRTAGALFSFITAFLLAYEPMKKLGRAQAQLQAGLAASERVFDLIDTPRQITDAPDAAIFAPASFDVAFNAVSFSYATDAPALYDISLNVPAGKTAALVGASGAGKTTVLNLIPRFYDVTGGSITIGGTDVRSVTQASLRAQIGIVSQDVILFDDTVRANIAYGREGATDEEIFAAARAAQADTFIRGLPNGYDTMIGELGVKISGGQRQRLAIARAMLKNAPILLLDEATSALDSESERAVQAALNEARTGRTTIIVAHRLSTIVDADIIYVLDHGRVAESGTHADLLAKRGAYWRLYGALLATADSAA